MPQLDEYGNPIAPRERRPRDEQQEPAPTPGVRGLTPEDFGTTTPAAEADPRLQALRLARSINRESEIWRT